MREPLTYTNPAQHTASVLMAAWNIHIYPVNAEEMDVYCSYMLRPVIKMWYPTVLQDLCTSFPKCAADVRVCTQDTEQDRRDEGAWATDVRQHEEKCVNGLCKECTASIHLQLRANIHIFNGFQARAGHSKLFLCIEVTIKEDQCSVWVRRHRLTFFVVLWSTLWSFL